MKKLYRKGTVHPSPPPPPPSIPDHHQFNLSFLPAAVLTLAAALSAADREVLAYLLSCSAATAAAFDKPKKYSTANNNNNHHHTPSFNCYCFSCYTSYWARWDSSPNRQLIHEIIDAFEEGLLKKKQGPTRKEKRKNNQNNTNKNNSKCLDLGLNDGGCDDGPGRVGNELGLVDSVEESGGEVGNGEDETGEKQGSVRKFVNLIGERIWGSVWG